MVTYLERVYSQAALDSVSRNQSDQPGLPSPLPCVSGLLLKFMPPGEFHYLLQHLIRSHSYSYQGSLHPHIARYYLVSVLQNLFALHRAGSEGYYHGDIKPDNLMMTEEGKPLLSDFGAAKPDYERVWTSEGFSGTVVYLPPEYFEGEGVAGRWYSFNVSAEQYFYVVPVDTSPAPRYAKALSNWMGDGVNLKFRLPAVPTFPRLYPLSILIEITCKSSPLALSCSSQPESFEFPRNPSLENIDIQLYSDLVLRDTAIESETITEKIMSGFNISRYGNHHGWCKDVEISRSAPTWAVDPNKPQQGFWSEGINVTGTLLFSDLYVPFHMGSISTSLTLKVQVGFPGLFNTARMVVDDLPISSGIPPRTMTKAHTTSYDDKDSNSHPMMEQDPNRLLLQAYVDVLNQR
ncbi:hypothetical protein M422DRAFT_266214 [Sphaerobolus stellatus SS14]|uniref:Unplaced genomic scaffold SPHSTscaffold_158, whole genome shotgun sequence n=1 Tax=Sphaerobolus stellatus (strain SS14) TaxID=990650 RepID=A0A0C9TPK1_SPHS4|nr:hypothetical protein M422DRAFT_266214 [Sphaerobolus stellatus SS14]